MADELNPGPTQPGNNQQAPKMPQIEIMPKPEPLKVNLSTASLPDEAVVTPVTTEGTSTKKVDENVFTQLFGDDKVMQSSNLMDTVNKHEDKNAKPVFSKKPSLKALKEKQMLKAKGKGQSGKVMLRVSFLLLILTSGFFFTQNKAEFTLFGTNPAQKVAVVMEEINNVQAEIHVQQHLSGVLLLDEFSSIADSYLYNLSQADSDLNSSNKQEEYAETAVENKLEAAVLLAEIQTKIESNLTPEEKIAATTLIGELIDALESRAGEVDEGSLSQDIEDLETTRNLIQSNDYRASLAGANLEELDDENINALLVGYTELNRSTQAMIASIRNDRVEWSRYFDEIETLTKKVDPLFNTEFPGSLFITDIQFDKNEISISGSTITDDTKNFTLISNYIDMLESSSSFMNVEDRSYTKSAGTNDFTGSFRISLEFE